MNKEIYKYLMEVKYLIPLSYKYKKNYIRLLENKLLEFEACYDSVTYDDIIEQFGSPKEVAHEFLSKIDTEVLVKRIKLSHYIKNLVIITILLISLISIWTCTLAYMDYKKAEEQIITEIEYTTPEELSNEKISD